MLLGTAGFWQGIDLPGDLLENLVLTRLPFGVPTEPRLQARMIWLASSWSRISSTGMSGSAVAAGANFAHSPVGGSRLALRSSAIRIRSALRLDRETVPASVKMCPSLPPPATSNPIVYPG